jgi:hypothetical protein
MRMFAALHYPYVLAFEPTFVEIRHVETGSMAQIIQGNNLRLLFADMPPSTTQSSAANSQFNQYQQQQQQQQSPAQFGAYNPYAGYGAQGSYSRQSVYSATSGYAPSAAAQSSSYQRPSGFGRDEVVFVSDDRVMTLRMTDDAASMSGPPLPPLPSAAASVYSVA